MFKNLLSSIGFEDLTVDTRVGQTEYHLGDTIEGIVELSGQTGHIEYIEIQLVERQENTDDTSDIQSFDDIISRVHLTPENDETIRFQLDAGHDIKSISNQFFIMTHVYIANSVDAYDEDEIFFNQQ
ncbi:sporulation protein [Macrococcus brunensis]|uniref:sporulation protein n=1 Tax=Macrococcus brunensis TaxID=198483 RepID=UPI001EEFE715|nr:sporulation protein [Macrococcus brunensis]ULG70947.1 sporulation protein [Macrococcus brunensis]